MSKSKTKLPAGTYWVEEVSNPSEKKTQSNSIRYKITPKGFESFGSHTQNKSTSDLIAIQRLVAALRDTMPQLPAYLLVRDTEDGTQKFIWEEI